MSRLSVNVDDALVEEAREALGTRTKRDTIVRALEEVVRRRRMRQMASRLGTLELGVTGEEILRQREES